MPLFEAGRARATERPILTGSNREMCRSWNGWELGWQASMTTLDITSLNVSLPGSTSKGKSDYTCL